LTLCHEKVGGQKQTKALVSHLVKSWGDAFPLPWVLLSLLRSPGFYYHRWKKNKKLNLMKKIDFVLCNNSRGGESKSVNQQNLQITGSMQPNYLGVYFPNPPQVCYHSLQVVEKIKELNLITED